MFSFLHVHVATVVTFLMTVLFASMVLRERRSPGGTWAWLLLFVLVPYVGIPVYLVIGNRKLRARLRKLSGRAEAPGKQPIYRRRRFGETPSTRADVERILLATGAPAPIDGNRIELISGVHAGEEAYARLIEAIRGAKQELELATFVLGGPEDAVAREILTALAERARAGVRVRLLLDRVGALITGPFWRRHRELAPLVRSGAEFAYFKGPLNLRNHRKLAVADRSVALIGGMNLAKEYLGPDPSPARWLDLAVRVEGPAALAIHDVFESDWAYAHGRPGAPASGSSECRGEARIQLAPSGPDLPDDSLYDAIVTAAFAARRRIWVATPYFVPDETLSRALQLACKREIDVRIVIPARSNHLLADFARLSYLRQICEASGSVRLYTPGMLHAKALLVDDTFALVGSANMDMRSLLLNYELGAVLMSAREVGELERWFEALFSKTSPYAPRPGLTREALEGLGRIVGPML